MQDNAVNAEIAFGNKVKVTLMWKLRFIDLFKNFFVNSSKSFCN